MDKLVHCNITVGNIVLPPKRRIVTVKVCLRTVLLIFHTAMRRGCTHKFVMEAQRRARRFWRQKVELT